MKLPFDLSTMSQELPKVEIEDWIIWYSRQGNIVRISKYKFLHTIPGSIVSQADIDMAEKLYGESI